ncbi:RNA-directed DNA polymerase [Dorea sp. D27]|uniref:RNA-directed DNA polymerase n=1 Tax=Dorea sp. D27 TaxID=658665 RepID=UPI0006731651|nr:RNA-directed DNA polymerase [Dorea sp. D27]KMZ55702.1 hypothetical protein HMPREF0980_00400 [Dorea sp. D27]
MGLNNIKRNSLDYILSDLLPVELPELYTHKYFYEYLIQHNKEVQKIIEKMTANKNDIASSKKMFEAPGWISMPLKYTIAKNLEADRELNIIQPIAILELFLFVTIYQKEILNYMEKNSAFSLRYHRKNNDLYYKQRTKSLTKYFDETSKTVGKSVLQQTGVYFDIGPFQSISSFTKSDLWFALNRKYQYFARTDFKSCFDSVYTHTFKWLIGKDVNDTKDFTNVNIFTTIDRILQNINARTSNGIIIGPEFSRMIAEILLEGIDTTVMNSLYVEGYKKDVEYVVLRYVDDIFIFGESEMLIDIILKRYEEVARKYMLSLNEAKLTKEKIPFVLDVWLKETSLFVTQTSNVLFYTEDERKLYIDKKKQELQENASHENSEDTVVPHMFKARVFRGLKPTLMTKFNELICYYPKKTKTIVSYTFGMVINKIERSRNKSRIFRQNVSPNTIYSFLDYIFYVYSFYTDFMNTQRLLSVISYINDETEFLDSTDVFQKLISKYAVVFEKSNINDVVNLILLCSEKGIEIPYRQECKIEEKIKKEDNPILFATYLIYAKYDSIYFEKILNEIEKILELKLDAILKKDNILTYREFWWIIIFNKCPFIKGALQNKFDILIANRFSLTVTDSSNAVNICTHLLGDFFLNSSKQFFEWDISRRSFLKEITFKTYERSVFKNYKFNYNFMEFNSLE